MIHKSFMLLCLSALCLSAMGQKIERESKVNANQAPEQAVRWMNTAFDGARKMQWYREITSEPGGEITKQSYEAKLRWERRFYSVEFDDTGIIEDIEIIIAWKDIPESTQMTLEESMSSHYDKFKIRKIQIQYTGAPEVLAKAVKTDDYKNITTRYEIEYFGRNEEGRHLWAGLFDQQGKPIERIKVEQRSADNMIF